MQLKKVSDNYDRAARYYDPMTDIVFGHILGLEKYRSYTIDLLGDITGSTVLDIGCGTGRNFPFLTRHVGKTGNIIGFDYSAAMLSKARQRIHREGWQNIELIRGDAVHLDGVSATVDAVVAIWCFGIIHDLETAIKTALDVLRPGGSIAIMDFDRSYPESGIIRWLFPLYSTFLRWAGIDSNEDLDNEKLMVKWDSGKDVIETRCEDLHVEHYLQGTGLILSAKKQPADHDMCESMRDITTDTHRMLTFLKRESGGGLFIINYF